MVTSKIYKIRDKETRLFSKGGDLADRPNLVKYRWSKKGKTWNSIGALKNHLNFFKKIPDTWEIIVYEVLTNPSHTISAKELMEDHVKNKK